MSWHSDMDGPDDKLTAKQLQEKLTRNIEALNNLESKAFDLGKKASYRNARRRMQSKRKSIERMRDKRRRRDTGRKR